MAELLEGNQLQSPVRGEMDGLEPITDSKSKKVMLTAERRDNITITDVVTRFDDSIEVPDEVSVIKRTHTYYGPELLVHAEQDGEDANFLLSAPGPDAHLYLWAGKLTEENRRESWYVAAEVKATLSDDQPGYKFCPDCGQPFKSIEHERLTAIGECPHE